MSVKSLLRTLPRYNSLNSFSRAPIYNSFSTSNKGPGQDNADLQNKETEFIKRGNADFQGLHVNEENIKRKQSEALKNRGLPMDNYTIKKPHQFYDPKANPNPTENVFTFHEENLLQTGGLIQIYGLASGYFTANDVWYPGSILVFPKQIFLWDVQNAADIRSHSFDIIEFIKPTPNYVIIGTGKDHYPLEESMLKKLKDKGIKVDVIPTFEACSTFNVCNEDGLNICAFLIPGNL